MCPCNLSFDHGATYDFCRVTLVFNIREGEVARLSIGLMPRRATLALSANGTAIGAMPQAGIHTHLLPR